MTSFGVKTSNKLIQSLSLNMAPQVAQGDKKNLKLLREEIVTKKVKDPKTGKMKTVKVKRKVFAPATTVPVGNNGGFGIRASRNCPSDQY
jgi:hypothetical protein